MKSKKILERLFLMEGILFAIVPAVITASFYIFDYAELALSFNNIIYIATIIVGITANTIISARLDSLNRNGISFLAILVAILFVLGLILIYFKLENYVAILSFSILFIIREMVRFKRNAIGLFLIPSVVWMPLFTCVWIVFSLAQASYFLYLYACIVFYITTFRLVKVNIDYISFIKSFKLLPSTIVEQGFSTGINLAYINATSSIYGSLFIRLISVLDLFWNVAGSHILSRASKNSPESVARFLRLTKNKYRIFLISPALLIAILAFYFNEPKLAGVSILKAIKYYVGWVYKILLLIGEKVIFLNINLIFMIALAISLSLIDIAYAYHFILSLAIIYHLTGYYFSKRKNT